MSADILSALLAANIAAGAVILLIVAIRKPVRRAVGARLAHWLWAIPVLAGLTTLLPARPAVNMLAPPAPIQPLADATVELATSWTTAVQAAPDAVTVPADLSPATAIDVAGPFVLIWLLGAVAMLAITLLQQWRTLRSLKLSSDQPARASDDFGPAVVGVLRPRLIVPVDFETRFDAAEQRLVVAHETAHLAAGHTRINAAAAAITALNWFNPLAHWAARLARVDQELACDAAVLERYPAERGVYAEALLKTQVNFSPLPLGCTWPSRSTRLFKERMVMLALKTPGRGRRMGGAGLIATIAAGAGLAAWAQKPPQGPATLISGSVISQLMPSRSDEEQDLWRFGGRPPSSKLMRLILELPVGYLEQDYPTERTIPTGMTVEATASVKLPNGKVLGPLRLINTRQEGYTSSERADGDQDKSNGDEHFIGAMLGSSGKDGVLDTKYAFVVEGRPLMLVGVRAKSGGTVEVNAAGGYRFTIKPILRPFNAGETRSDASYQKWLAKGAPLPKPKSIRMPSFRAFPGPIWDGPPPPPPADMSKLANKRVACGDWKTKFSNDPQVDIARTGAAPLVAVFDAKGKVQLTAPNDGFAKGVFPDGLESQLVRVTQTVNSVAYLTHSPSLADVVDIFGIFDAVPWMSWERVRRDNGITYRTKFFARCTRV